MLVNGRVYQTDLAYDSTELARENAAMRAFMVCRNFSINGGMLARNGIVQGLPVIASNRKSRYRQTSSGGRLSNRSNRSEHDYSSSASTSSTTTASSSAVVSNDPTDPSVSVGSSHEDDDIHVSKSSKVASEAAALRKVALMNNIGHSARHVDSREGTEAYRQSLEEYGQTSASPQDLTRALESHNYNKTQWLLERFFDQVAVQEYSWLTELIQLGFSPLEITDELLEKAIQGSWVHEPFEDPHSESFALGYHQTNCVHINSPVESVRYTGYAEELVDPKNTSSLHGRNIIASGLGDGVQDEKTPQPGSQELRDRLESLSKPVPDRRGASLTARQRVEYFCGLGGVRPAADGSTDIEFGSVSFDKNNSKASITLNGPADNSAMIEVLDSLDRAAGELQRLGGCCDSFSVLLDSATKDYVELHQVPFWTIRRLRELVIDPDMTGHFGRAAGFFLDLIGGADFMSGHTVDAGSLQHWVLLATQFLALGLLSYAQAHCGSIQPFFLDTPLQAISLLGSGKSESEPTDTLTCYLVELTCMGDMLGQPVLVFGWLSGPAVDERQVMPQTPRKNMLASPEDILDTWGSGCMVASANDSNVLYSVVVGGGTITSTGEHSDPATRLQLHWSKQVTKSLTATSTFLRKAKAFIGTTILENNACQSAAARLMNSLPMLEEIGTFPSYWELMERQLGLGVQGGQAAVAILQFNQTWVKRNGATKKSVMLSQRPIYISDLDSMFGVQVSICTGVARRVRLRDLLADLLPAYVSGLVVEPLLWKDLVGKFNALAALRESDTRQWLESLDHPCRVEFERLVFAVLYLLRDTGIDRKGDHFVIACVQSDLPFQCFKIPCKNENYWARMLIDSEDSATFAYITTQCLETPALKCCRPSPSWSNSTALLGTAVSQDRVSADYALAAASGIGPWTLKENEAYLLGRPDKVLYVQVKTPSGLDPHLLVSLSTIPPTFLNRLFKKGKPKRLREKKCFDSCAESVVICVEKTGVDVQS